MPDFKMIKEKSLHSIAVAHVTIVWAFVKPAGRTIY
jgi:hypothetical protein